MRVATIPVIMAEDAFHRALAAIFDNWTVLALAVQHCWGGRNTKQKCDQLHAEVVEYLAAGGRKKRPPSHENLDDVEELAAFFDQRLDELFHCDVEDDSDRQVAAACLQLFNACRAGDMSVAQQILQLKAPDLSSCKGVDNVQYATQEDALVDGFDGMDIDSDASSSADANLDGPEAGDGVAPEQGEVIAVDTQARRRNGRAEPQIDEDGFVMCGKGRRRP